MGTLLQLLKALMSSLSSTRRGEKQTSSSTSTSETQESPSQVAPQTQKSTQTPGTADTPSISVSPGAIEIATTFIKQWEGCKLTSYQDQKGVWTIGYGHTGSAMPGMTITQEQAEKLFSKDLGNFCIEIKPIITVPVNDREMAALLSFAFNLGVPRLKGSTLLKLLNAGIDRKMVADEFRKWNKVDGVVNVGLIRRREAETKLFLS